MQNKSKQFGLAILLLGATLFALPLKAQVTIGDLTAPQSFSLLELTTTNVTGGLRLPQLTTDDRDAITTDDFKNSLLAKGLMIFNTTTGCVNLWNGSEWIEFCGSAINPSIAFPSLPSVVLTVGKQTSSLGIRIAYSDKTEGDIVLTDGQLLGSSDGLSLVVDGAQTLSSVNGVINVKLIGTPAKNSKITIPVSIKDATCLMEVNVVKPSNNI